LKPDNIIFNSKTIETKLCDFTVSRNELEFGVTRLYDSEGTVCFTAPECHVVEKGGYDPFPTDIWSLGCCIYTYCNFGKLPFYGASELEIQIASKDAKLEMPEHFSPNLKELIAQMLDKDPSKRPTA
jgi:serine/threonine protein kinase